MSIPNPTIRLSNQWMTAASNTCTVTITFDGQRVSGMTLNNFRSVDYASISNVRSDDGGLTWLATLTANPDTEAAGESGGGTGFGSTFSLVYNGLAVGTDTTPPNSGISSPNYYIDTKPPKLDSIKVDYRSDGSGNGKVTFKFSEPVTGFARDDVTVLDGRGRLTTEPASSDGGLTWTADINSPAGQINNDRILTVNLAGVTDTKLGGGRGNNGVGTSDGGDNYSVDSARPALAADGLTVAYASGANALGAGAEATVTIKFTEAVTSTSFTITDLTVPGGRGTLSDLHSTDGGTTWQAKLTAPTGADVTDANVTITLNLAGVEDSAGNTGSNDDPHTASYAVDTKRPGASMVLSKNLLATAGTSPQSVTLTVTFDEPVTGTLTTNNFTAPNATLSDLTAVAGGRVWTATLTPTAGTSAASNTVSLNITGMRDAAGNSGSTDAVSATYSTDGTRPTLADSHGIELGKGTLAANDSTTVTFNFSEAVAGLDNADVDLPTGCSLSDLKPVNDSGEEITGDNPASARWTATLHTGAGAQSAADAAISVKLDGVNDSAGNAGTGNSAVTHFAIDSSAPTATIAVGEGTRTSAGVTTHQVTITFSELVSGFAAGKLTADNGTLSNLQALDGSGQPIGGDNPASTASTTWRATLTTTADVDDASNAVRLDTTDMADAAGNRFASSTVTSNNYVVDNRGPVLDTATVNGNQLVLTFTDASNLDATHGPALTAFEVKADGVTLTVLQAVVNAEAKTVTLTLNSAVTYGQSVTVRYTDPTTGDDSNAIQDTFGHDAASIPAPAPTPDTPAPGQPVTNNTPNPWVPPPAPTPAPEPKPGQDGDKDGVPDSVENQAPGIRGPNGAQAVTGDANGDGVQDSQQATVASASFARGPQGGSNPEGLSKTPVTLTISGQDGKPASDPGGAAILSLEQKDAATGLPAKMEQPIGLVSFQAKPDASGASQNFSLYVDADLGVNGYWVKDNAGTWTNLASEAQGGKMVTEDGRLRLDFQLTDGGRYDSDGLADGAISATGAAAHMPLTLTGQAPDAVKDGLFWF